MQPIILDNGVRVLLKESRDNDIVAMKVVLRMGGRYETDGLRGVSNLALQGILKGTRKATSEQIAERLDSIGSQLETGSDKDGSSASLLCTREALMPTLDILWDVLLYPTFPKDEMVSEKKRIVMEIRQDEDSPMTYTYRNLQRLLYGNHPYGWPNKGTLETLKQLKRRAIREFYFDHLLRSDIVVCAVGNLDRDELLRWSEHRFGSIEKDVGRISEPEDEVLLPVPSGEPKVHEEQRRVEAEVLTLGYLAPSVLSPDLIPMQILNCILGNSMDSRLFVEVRDKRGLAYSVGSSYTSRIGPAMLSIYVATDPKNHDCALAQCLAEVEKLKDEKVEEDELRRAKEYMKGTFIMAQETNMGQAGLYASSEYVGLGCAFVEEYGDLVESVTSEQVRELARKYLNDYSLAVTKPGTRQ